MGDEQHSRRSRPAGLALVALLAVQLAVPGPAGATTYESYTLSGYEVWYAPTNGMFVGTGSGSGVIAAWYGSIEHSGVISPVGAVTGGWATLYRPDGVRISGHFADGAVWLLDDGPGCTDEAHAVRGNLAGVTRSDSAAVGSGYFEATLIHHRAWLFGRCISYSASVNGTMSLIF